MLELKLFEIIGVGVYGFFVIKFIGACAEEIGTKRRVHDYGAAAAIAVALFVVALTWLTLFFCAIDGIPM